MARMMNTLPGGNPMRKPRPLRWIEEAEAREVLAIARSQSPASPFAPLATKPRWRARVRRWVAAEPTGASPVEIAVAEGKVEPRRS